MMKKAMLGAGVGAAIFLLVTGVAFAESPVGLSNTGGASVSSASVSLPNPITGCSNLTCVAGKVINFLYVLAIPITAIMALVGGFKIMTSAGDPQKYSEGRKTLMYAAIGFCVILLAGGVVSIIKSVMGG